MTEVRKEVNPEEVWYKLPEGRDWAFLPLGALPPLTWCLAPGRNSIVVPLRAGINAARGTMM